MQASTGWSLWAAIIILCREILVSGLREYLAALKVSCRGRSLPSGRPRSRCRHRLPAGRSGRDKIFPADTTQTGWCCCGSRRSFTLYTGYDYFRAGLKHIMDE